MRQLPAANQRTSHPSQVRYSTNQIVALLFNTLARNKCVFKWIKLVVGRLNEACYDFKTDAISVTVIPMLPQYCSPESGHYRARRYLKV